MKKFVVCILISGSLFWGAPQAKADLFGGDVAVLVQILANAIQQLLKLKEVVDTGKKNLALIKEINRGINDSLKLIRNNKNSGDPGLYKTWDKVEKALQGIESIYGSVAKSPEARVQRDADQSVAEAVTLNNSLYKYAAEIDQIGEEIKSYSHSVSPGGAQKLTAQSIGVLLKVMNQSLRAQATGLKLQAQSLAIENKREKEYTKHVLDTSSKLSMALKTQDTSFSLPRFK